MFDFRFGIGVIVACLHYVRFTPKSGHDGSSNESIAAWTGSGAPRII